MVAEALGGALTGATSFAEGEQTRNCVFMWGIRIGAFQSDEETRLLQDLSIQKVRTTPPAPGFERVLIPGDPERISLERRIEEGVPIPDGTWQSLTRVADQLGVQDEMPCR